jgi:ATP-binding cassette, subfamily B, multidrug efflux pump
VLRASCDSRTERVVSHAAARWRGPAIRSAARERAARTDIEDSSMIRLLRTFLKPYRTPLGLVLLLLLAQAMTSLALPNLNAAIINHGVAKGDVTYIIRTGVVMLVVTVIMGAAAVAAVFWGARTAMAFGRDVRAALFRHVLAFSQAEVNRFGTASLITRNTNDVQQVQMVVLMALNMMILSPVLAIGGIVMAIREDAPLSLVLVVALPLMGAFIGVMLARAMPLFRAMQVKLDAINQVAREKLAGIRVIRAFVRTDVEERRFDLANAQYADVATRVGWIFAVMIPTLFGILNLSTVAVVGFGSVRVASGGMPIGNLTAYVTYITLILMSVMMATMMFAMVPRAAASAERILEVLDAVPSVCDPASPVAPAHARGRLEFRDVEFRYPHAEDPVLSGITFTAEPGEITAIVGSTGSGKSTLVNLVPRFFDVTAGSVVLDGVDVRAMRQQDVWTRIGFVPQRAFLFAGTVARNLRYGDEAATDADLWQALDVAQATGFVKEMDGGLEAMVSQGGTTVSGGQRQRLAIARALVRKPSIYVFDDCFSALDVATDARLRAALEKVTADATVIVVAQRVSTIRHARKIVVLESGRVAGIGTHETLMRENETYREIVFSQLTEGEAA